MWTLKLAPAARSVGPHDSFWGVGGAVLTEHRPALLCVSIDHVTPVPEPAGSGSLTVTPCAVPVPPLVTLTVNPIGSPAFTVFASASLVILISAGWQVILSSAVPPPSLVELAVAVLS